MVSEEVVVIEGSRSGCVNCAGGGCRGASGLVLVGAVGLWVIAEFVSILLCS